MSCFEMESFRVEFPDHAVNEAIILAPPTRDGDRVQIGSVVSDRMGLLWSWEIGAIRREGFASARAAGEDAIRAVRDEMTVYAVASEIATDGLDRLMSGRAVSPWSW